jgi:hypothetical protein
VDRYATGVRVIDCGLGLSRIEDAPCRHG